MINTILTDILRTFSKDEIKRFEEMINSSFFNKNTPVIKLFEQVRKYYPEFKSIKLKREDVYERMFPDKKYNYGSMKNIIYELQKLCEQFIINQELSKNEFDLKRALVSGLNDRGLTNLSEKNLKELENSISGKEINDNEYFLKQYFINRIKQTQIFESSKGNIHSNQKVRTPYYEQNMNSINSLKKYYLLDTLKTYNKVITNKNIFDTERAIVDVDKFVTQYKDDFDELSIRLEKDFLNMNLGKINESEFLELKKLILTDLYGMEADKNLTYAGSIYLLNYCRIKNHTDKSYKVHAFDILKSLVENENYDSGHASLDIVLCRNIIVVSTELHEFEWIENFLKASLKKIHPEYRENIMKFYFAFKHYHEGNFEKSLECLSDMNSDDIFNKNYIKELAIMNYFELKYFDLLNEQIESYKKFLVNNEMLPDSYKIQCRSFISYVTKLFKAASEKKIDLQFLKKKITNERELLYKSWLLKKIDELIET
ncbi:MAG: hypothetical protein ABI462_10695 [Ignavibacteria bacterium]